MMIGGVIVGFVVFVLIISAMFRTVVPTNHVHIVQKKKRSIPYGKDQSAGNVYYNFPHWLPVIGLERIILPVSNFTIELNDYQAYDNGKVPFGVDVKAFFSISNPALAAQKVESFGKLREQLEDILKGAIRKILASEDIEEIMTGRGKFGDEFTKEVGEQLSAWGVKTVKSIELMDIRDGNGSTVITDIMEKKKSKIEMESRTAVALNNQKADIAEINATKETNLERENAERIVGEKKAEVAQKVGVADELSRQKVAEQEKETAVKDMAVKQVEFVRAAEIEKEVQVVKAQEEKETSIVRADGEKQETIAIAEGNLSAEKKRAEGLQSVGLAEAEAAKAMALAPVIAEIELFTKIAQTPEYMEFLIQKEQVSASQAVGVAKAKALENGDLKIIANTGSEGVDGGINNILDMFSTHGGTKLAGMIESFAQTEKGEKIISSIIGDTKKAPVTRTKKKKAQTSEDRAVESLKPKSAEDRIGEMKEG